MRRICVLGLRVAGLAFALLTSWLFFALDPASAEMICRTGSGHVCLYQHGNFGGCIARYFVSDSDYRNNNFDDDGTFTNPCGHLNLNDKTSSVKNRGNSYSTRHYEHTGYGGAYRTLGRGLDWSSVFINDEFSAHQWIA
jgi:hypothetical protein